MALKKCPNCGTLVSDASQFCEQCGCRLSADNTTKPVPDTTLGNDSPALAVPAKKGSKKAIVVISVLLAILILGGIALYLLVLQPRNEAKKLDALLEGGKWSEAIAFINKSGKEEYNEHLSECYYNLGQEQMAAEKWEDAVESLSSSKKTDADALIEECYKHIKSDYSFQEVFEECIAYRCTEETDNSLVSDTCKAELEKLKPFVSADFYSAELKHLATKYYKALELQYNYYISDDYDVEDWRNAYSTRISIIYQLINDYGFFADKLDVREEYIELGEEVPICMKAERDLDYQLANNLDNIIDMNDDGEVTFTFQNDQNYNISVHIDMYYEYDDGGDDDAYYWDFSRVKARSSFTLNIPEPDEERGKWSWSMYFDVFDVVD